MECFNKVNSARSVMENRNFVLSEMRTRIEQENKLSEQTLEAKKQTSLLEQARELNNENIICIKQMIECTLQNQISSNKQFRASMAVSIVAIAIALVSLIYGCLSSTNTTKLYEIQLDKQDKIIELLNNNKGYKSFNKF